MCVCEMFENTALATFHVIYRRHPHTFCRYQSFPDSNSHWKVSIAQVNQQEMLISGNFWPCRAKQAAEYPKKKKKTPLHNLYRFSNTSPCEAKYGYLARLDEPWRHTCSCLYCPFLRFCMDSHAASHCFHFFLVFCKIQCSDFQHRIKWLGKHSHMMEKEVSAVQSQAIVRNFMQGAER